VVIPENVCVNRIEARLANFGESIAPHLGTDSRIRTLHAEDEGICTMYGEALGVVADDVRPGEEWGSQSCGLAS